MDEIKRVLFGKRYILILITLFIANIAIFQYYQMNALDRINSEDELEIFIKEQENKQYQKHEEFYRKIKSIPEDKEKLLGISIFSDENSFAYKNIIKTCKDYERISDVELSDINDYAVDAFLEYNVIYIFGFIIMLFTIIAFLDERRKGLWQIVHACRGGRLRLVLKRLLILFITSIVTETVLITSVLTVSFLDYGGADILMQPVQSVGKLQDFVMPVTLLIFFVIYILFLAAAFAVSGLFIWLVLSLIHNINMGLITCSFIYVVEFFLNYFISSRNPLCILKYTNLWFFINPLEVFTSYINFMFAGFMFNCREYLSVMLIIVLVILSVGVMITGVVTKPFYTPGIIETIVCRIMDKLRKILISFGGMGYELYKMLVQKKGIIVIAGLLYVFISNIYTTELLLSPERMQLDNFYADYTGEIDEISMKAYTNIENNYKSQIAKNDESNEATIKMLELLTTQKDYAQSLEKNGIKGWFINDRGYKLLFGEMKSNKRVIDGMLAILALVLLIAPSYVSEYQCGINYIIASSKKGRGTVFRRKMVYCLLCTGIISITMLAVQFYEVSLQYDLTGFSAPVQNIAMLEQVPLNISIGEFIILWYIARVLILFMSSCVIMLLSAYGRIQNRVYLFSVFLIPLGLINGIYNYSTSFVFFNTTIVPIVVCTLISVVSIYLIYRKWTNKRRFIV